jgi:DNA-damage-inducible protein D
MDRNSIIEYKSSFDSITTFIEGENNEQVEIWFARDLQTVLGYTRWENFQTAIKRAVESCNSQGINIDDHFREVTKMVNLKAYFVRKVEVNDKV